MTWLGPPLDRDQTDLLEAVGSLLDGVDRDPQALREALVPAGWWTVGTDPATGGGGADEVQTTLVLAALARRSAAVAWLSVQAQLGIEMLAGQDGWQDVVTDLHAGRAGFTLVRGGAVDVTWTVDGADVRGSLGRVEHAGPTTYVGVLVDGRAWVVRPEAVADVRRPDRTGLRDAEPGEVVVRGEDGRTVHAVDVDATALLRRRNLGLAAVAAGLAWEATVRAGRYVHERRQFGRPLADLPAVRAGQRGRLTRTSALLGAVLGAAGASGGTAAAVAADCSVAAVDVIGSALLAHGGYGYLQEYGIEGMLRDAVSLRATADPDLLRADVDRELAAVAGRA